MHCEFYQYQLDILPIRRVVADSTETNDQYFQNQVLYCEKRCRVEVSFHSPSRLLWWLLSILELFPSFGGKKFQHEKSWLKKWVAAEELRRRGCLSLKEPKQKGIFSETGTSWGSLEIPTRSSRRGPVETNPTRNHDLVGLILGLASGLRIWCCCELWCSLLVCRHGRIGHVSGYCVGWQL